MMRAPCLKEATVESALDGCGEDEDRRRFRCAHRGSPPFTKRCAFLNWYEREANGDDLTGHQSPLRLQGFRFQP